MIRYFVIPPLDTVGNSDVDYYTYGVDIDATKICRISVFGLNQAHGVPAGSATVQ